MSDTLSRFAALLHLAVAASHDGDVPPSRMDYWAGIARANVTSDTRRLARLDAARVEVRRTWPS